MRAASIMNPGPTSAEALRAYIAAPDETAAGRWLETLITSHAQPVVSRALSSKAGTAGLRHTGEQWDLEEVASHAKLRLVAKLQSLRTQSGTEAIDDFEGYAAATAHSCWAEHLREKFPRRAMLRNQLRYLLEEQAERNGLALRENADGLMAAGLAEWKPRPLVPAAQMAALVERLAASTVDWRRLSLPAALRLLLQQANGPVAMEPLVGALAQLRQIKDDDVSIDAEDPSGEPKQFADASASPADDVAWREQLRWLWRCVQELSLRQRTAFILHMEDVKEFELHGIASIRSVAGVLEITAEELAELWPDIPLDDLRIAARMNATRQQVINLRMVARDKIRRRLPELLAA
jgi:hypothetical protein